MRKHNELESRTRKVVFFFIRWNFNGISGSISLQSGGNCLGGSKNEEPKPFQWESIEKASFTISARSIEIHDPILDL